MPLAVVEADRLDACVSAERVGEADGRVLPPENSTSAPTLLPAIAIAQNCQQPSFGVIYAFRFLAA